MGQVFTNLADWPFLNEPIYRWFVFLIIVILFLHVWNGVMDHIR